MHTLPQSLYAPQCIRYPCLSMPLPISAYPCLSLPISPYPSLIDLKRRPIPCMSPYRSDPTMLQLARGSRSAICSSTSAWVRSPTNGSLRRICADDCITVRRRLAGCKPRSLRCSALTDRLYYSRVHACMRNDVSVYDGPVLRCAELLMVRVAAQHMSPAGRTVRACIAAHSCAFLRAKGDFLRSPSLPQRKSLAAADRVSQVAGSTGAVL